MPDWLIERGIGEDRLVLVERGEIIEARIMLEGLQRAGSIIEAKLRHAGTPAIGVAQEQEFLLPKGAFGITEGESFPMLVTREAIPGGEPWKRPLGRVADKVPRHATVPDARSLPFPAPDDPLEQAGWSELLEEARSGIVRFPGGELRVSPTPAMTLIDVDGTLPPIKLALAGAEAAAKTIRRHGVGGSIGIDLPTIAGKAQRQEIAERIDDLLPQPFERTSINGFGFLQIVRSRAHASLFELALDRAPFEARALLRAAARHTGAVRISAHPAIIQLLESRAEWIGRLARQVGGAVTLRSDPSLPISAGHVDQG